MSRRNFSMAWNQNKTRSCRAKAINFEVGWRKLEICLEILPFSTLNWDIISPEHWIFGCPVDESQRAKKSAYNFASLMVFWEAIPHYGYLNADGKQQETIRTSVTSPAASLSLITEKCIFIGNWFLQTFLANFIDFLRNNVNKFYI